MRNLFLSFLFCLIPSIVFAYPENACRAPYALTGINYNKVQPGATKSACQDFLTSIKDLPSIKISFLYNTFGNNFACLNKLIASGKMSALQVHLVNEVCARNKRCGPYEFMAKTDPGTYNTKWAKNDAKLIAAFAEYVKPVQAIIAKLPSTTACYISGGLESNLTAPAAKNMNAQVKKLFPTCKSVFSTFTVPNSAGADIYEQHGSQADFGAPCIVNLDGEDIWWPDRANATPNKILSEDIPGYFLRYSSCDMACLWTVEDNCGLLGVGFIDPRLRVCKPNGVNQKQVELLKKTPNFPKADSNYPWTEKELTSRTGCQKFIKANDGAKRGFLIKESDTPGRGGVVLFPGGLVFKKIQFINNGRVFLESAPAGYYTEDGGKRQMYRLSKSIAYIPYHTVLKADGGKVCVNLKNPKVRQD